ncbi:MAG TPA: diguanylate cyclase [Rhodanobacteraceae bacterium]
MMQATAATSIRDAECERGQRFAGRVRYLRVMTLLLGGLSVAVVLYRDDASIAAWVAMLTYVLVWPHLAYAVTRRSPNAIAVEKRTNIMLDAAMAGIWVALMHFNLVPSVALVMPMGMLLISYGGLGMLLRGYGLTALVCAITTLLWRIPFQLHSDTLEIIASLPILVATPLVTSWLMYRFERQVRNQNRLLFKLGSVDSLSELLNRRHWEDAVAESMAAHRRANRSAAMLLIDIDRFKHVNDEFGHTIGDEVIARVGATIRANLREGDLAGRYGGDEFGVVLVGADVRVAALVAERIRASVAAALFESAPDLKCTLSIGIASSEAVESGETREWIKHADAALYSAKRAGRNRYATATQALDESLVSADS